ncbi:MAG: TonB-dependent receptor [Pseudomonadota bacterium]
MKRLISATVLSAVAVAPAAWAESAGRISGNEFNPAISLILDGRYVDRDAGELALPGFQLGGESGFPEQGFTTGHNELALTANIDDTFYGALHAAIVQHDGKTELELEEAFVETLGLGHGVTIKGGRFLSGIGYLNAIHAHAHDFADRPLVYDALLGGQLADTGAQVRWVAPTEQYLNLGAEITSGSAYPSGENGSGDKGLGVFVKTGGDWNVSSSWQLGASYYRAKFDKRETGAHAHGAETAAADNELLNGEVDVAGLDFVYKWAPNGNARQTNLKLQAEYFVRNEQAAAEFAEGNNRAEADYDGKQTGFYAQAVYQFQPGWRLGVRYDRLNAENTIANFSNNGIDLDEFLEESGLGAEGDPNRTSLMLDYAPSHFSRIRLQYSKLDNGHDEKHDMLMLQYVMSLGSHGAHTF